MVGRKRGKKSSDGNGRRFPLFLHPGAAMGECHDQDRRLGTHMNRVETLLLRTVMGATLVCEVSSNKQCFFI